MQLSPLKYYQQNIITRLENKLTLRLRKSTLRDVDAHARVSTARDVRSAILLYKNNARALLSRILSVLNLDWLLYARSVRRWYELQVLHRTWFYFFK